MLFGLLVFGAIVLVLFSFVTTYNGLVAAAEKATRAWNDLDALLRQLHDEIPKLVETCEPHLAHERPLFERILEARAAMFAARQTRDADALSRAGGTLRTALERALAARGRSRGACGERVVCAAAATLHYARPGDHRSARPLQRGGARLQRH